MVRKVEITLNNLTSALKTIYGAKIEVPVLILRHWIKNTCDPRQVTPDLFRELERGYLEQYERAVPLEHEIAVDLLKVYDAYLHRTTTAEERQRIAIAAGCTPIEFKIREEGFSLRELMQALKLFDRAPAHWPREFLIRCFERHR
jgi:hypothetical protein